MEIKSEVRATLVRRMHDVGSGVGQRVRAGNTYGERRTLDQVDG